jgi:homoserine/homoserine lactone efflux protein
MTWASFGAFVVAMTALCVVPGPAVMLVLSQALRHGAAKAVWSILGITAAGTAWFVMSATGIGAILLASYELFFAIKWIGVAYLFWLGVATFFRSSGFALPGPASSSDDPARLFWGGFVLQMANPNVLLFFTAFLPQFIAPKQPLLPQIAILALATAIIELAVQLAYAFLAGRLRDVLAAPRFARLTDRVAGSLLIVAGLGMAAIRRAQ